MGRPSWCAGAILFDAAMQPYRRPCPNQTGDPLVPQCAACRVVERLERERYKKAMQRKCPHCGQFMK